MQRCAILDDYQNIALSTADWGALGTEVDVTVFNDHIAGHESLVTALHDFDIIVAMRERTRFDAELLRALPKLRLLVTTAMHNAAIDLAAYDAQGITGLWHGRSARCDGGTDMGADPRAGPEYSG